MSSVKRKFSVPVKMIGAAIAVIAIVIVGLVAVFGPGQNDTDGTTDPRTVALNQGTPFYDPSTSVTPTPASTKSTTPSPTVSSPTSKPTPSTVASKPSPATEPPAKTAAPTKPVVVDEGDEVVIGGLRIVLPSDYDVYEEDGLEALASGPDTLTRSNHILQPTLRMSAVGFNDMPEELGELMEGICPSGADVEKYDPQKPGEDIMDGDRLTWTRDVYLCPGGQYYSFASWQLEVAGTDGYRFIAEYFYPSDRRPAELTEAFLNAKGFGHN